MIVTQLFDNVILKMKTKTFKNRKKRKEKERERGSCMKCKRANRIKLNSNFIKLAVKKKNEFEIDKEWTHLKVSVILFEIKDNRKRDKEEIKHLAPMKKKNKTESKCVLCLEAGFNDKTFSIRQ